MKVPVIIVIIITITFVSLRRIQEKYISQTENIHYCNETELIIIVKLLSIEPRRDVARVKFFRLPKFHHQEFKLILNRKVYTTNTGYGSCVTHSHNSHHSQP